MLLVGFEPEDESPIVFLRLRKAAFKKRTQVFSIAPMATHGLTKMRGRLVATPPGGEAETLVALKNRNAPSAPTGIDADRYRVVFADATEALAQPGAVIVVGERLAGVAGALSAAAALAEATGAKLAWIPRRAGERGALEAGAVPNLLPGGRPVGDPDAVAPVALRWATTVSQVAGRDTSGIIAAAAAGELRALVVAGVDPDDLPDPAAARAALAAAPFVVSLELRRSAVTDYADVVFPVAAAAEKAGTYLDWEGRSRPFAASMKDTAMLSDFAVLNALADALDTHLGLPDLRTARAELQAFSSGYSGRVAFEHAAASSAATAHSGEALLASWHELLDAGSLQDNTPYLAATAKPVRAHLSPATAAGLRLGDGDTVTVSSDRGSITLPVYVTAMVDSVVWLPARSTGSHVYATLGVAPGAVVRLEKGGAA